MQRFDQRVVHAHLVGLVIVRPVDRPHAPEQIGHLLGRVHQELGDDRDRPQRPHDRRRHHEIADGAPEPLSRGEAGPLALVWCHGGLTGSRPAGAARGARRS